MGLDQYFYTRKILSASKKKEKLYIDYFDTITDPKMDTDEGLFISEHWGDVRITEILRRMPLMYGQVGNIRMVNRVGKTYQIFTEAMYWRKANQIQNWFVEHPQGGIDDCGYHSVDPIQLEDLQDRINKILDGFTMPSSDKFFNSHNNWVPSMKAQLSAMNLLPTTSGFFFGSPDYNKWYFNDLRITHKFLPKVLKKSTRQNWDFIYHSSW